MYETEPRYNDPRYNSIPDITGIKKKKRKKRIKGKRKKMADHTKTSFNKKY